MRRTFITLAVSVAPGPSIAHDAFGDLGPFYTSLLHPLADPIQGLLIAAIAILLARQPLAIVRPAYAALVLTGTATILLGTVITLDPPNPRMTGLIAAVLGGAAIFCIPLRPRFAILLAGVVAFAAGLAFDLPPGPRAAGLSALGAALGMAVATLLVWSLADAARSRLGPIAGSVAGSWVVAVGIMAAALPAG